MRRCGLGVQGETRGEGRVGGLGDRSEEEGDEVGIGEG